MHVRRFAASDYERIIAWLTNDAVGAAYLTSYVVDDWVPLIDFRRRFLWLASHNDEAVGFFDFEIESSQKCYFSFYIAPRWRGQGLGTQLLLTALCLPEVQQVSVLEGGVSAENRTSQHLLEALGFVYQTTDEDGMRMYAKPLLRGDAVSVSA